MSSITESELLAFLRSVETGEVILTPQEEPQEVYAGPVAYTASNGWSLAVFNDANEWDYIEQVRTADGRECNYDDIFARMPAVDAYQPSSEVSWMRYRIPGYLKFRCIKCGQLIRPLNSSYVCSQCT